MAKRETPWWRSWWPAKTPGGQSAGPHDERRAAPRHPCKLLSFCQPVNRSDEERWAGRLRDISVGGVGLVLKRRFEPGTLLRVEVPGASGEAPAVLWVRVVRQSARADGQWLVGCV